MYQELNKNILNPLNCTNDSVTNDIEFHSELIDQSYSPLFARGYRHKLRKYRSI